VHLPQSNVSVRIQQIQLEQVSPPLTLILGYDSWSLGYRKVNGRPSPPTLVNRFESSRCGSHGNCIETRYAVRVETPVGPQHYSPHYTVCCNRSPEEAGEYVRTLQAVLRSVAASDGNMEQVCMPLDGVPT